jgi:hypothetical protein
VEVFYNLTNRMDSVIATTQELKMTAGTQETQSTGSGDDDLDDVTIKPMFSFLLNDLFPIRCLGTS